MNILVTGGAGFIGSMVTQHLLTLGHRVRALDTLQYGGAPLLGLYHHDGFEFVHGDVRSDRSRDAALAGVEAVVHLAAIVGDPACARQPDLAQEINQVASLQLFEASRRQGVARFVFASTCSNYGKMADPAQHATENTELHPVSLYAETKVAVEQALLSAPAGDGPQVTVLRFATVYGISPRMRFDLTVNEFSMELFVRRKLVVYGEQFWRPYVHVRDAARAVGLVVEAPGERVDRQVYNVGDTRENYQKKQLVDLISDEVGGGVEINYVHKEEDPRDYRVSFEKAGEQLGFRITRTVHDGVREVIGAIRQRAISDVDNPCYRN